jgi:hypothetical protein
VRRSDTRRSVTRAPSSSLLSSGTTVGLWHVRAAQNIALCLPVRSSRRPAALAPSSTCLGPPLLLLTRRGSFISVSCRSMEHMAPWTPSTRDMLVVGLLLDATTVSRTNHALRISPRRERGRRGYFGWPRRSRAASTRSVCYAGPECLGGQQPEPILGHLRHLAIRSGKLVTRRSDRF